MDIYRKLDTVSLKLSVNFTHWSIAVQTFIGQTISVWVGCHNLMALYTVYVFPYLRVKPVNYCHSSRNHYKRTDVHTSHHISLVV